MKTARNTSAMTMPTIRASCWYFLGTLKLAMMMMKMNRLSTDRLYSVSQPEKNWRPKSPSSIDESLWYIQIQMPKAMAMPT
jgi:hypothetical protein